jgi:hypothetical protein
LSRGKNRLLFLVPKALHDRAKPGPPGLSEQGARKHLTFFLPEPDNPNLIDLLEKSPLSKKAKPGQPGHAKPRSAVRKAGLLKKV